MRHFYLTLLKGFIVGCAFNFVVPYVSIMKVEGSFVEYVDSGIKVRVLVPEWRPKNMDTNLDEDNILYPGVLSLISR